MNEKDGQVWMSDPDLWYGKTCPEHFPQTEERISELSFKKSSGLKIKRFLYLDLRKGNGGGAGLIVGDGFSVGWRVLDAKYWGVPQRRKRIALVADFAGSRAGQILFDGESLHGNHRESETEGERTPVGTPGSTGRADQLFAAQSHGEYAVRNSASTIRSRDAKGGTVDLVYCLQGNGIDRALTAGCNGRGWKENVSYTLNTVDRPAVAMAVENHGIDGRYRLTGKIETISRHNGTGGGNAPMCMETGKKVRRITPLECERLQGYPDGWTDIGEWVSPSTGRVRKSSDAARYQALGNSIALPPWKYILKRISAVYERDATMASLFDGIGGFPYLWEQINGKGSCRWASEVEEFAIAVTERQINRGGKAMYKVIKGVTGRRLSFKLPFTDEENEKEYIPLQEGEAYFFTVAPEPIGVTGGTGLFTAQEGIDLVSVTGAFTLSALSLRGGEYRFDAGVQFEDGARQTVIFSDEGILKVIAKANPDAG